ncbi:polysaccharide biosynthesis tyrosine autokinase [Zoogloea sp.]|uniref:polysaccharide biosynthesis tyrosine autokinase n=1 Tax=Zoogloea sp. TaxID=49181 RepID=UPI0035AF852C
MKRISRAGAGRLAFPHVGELLVSGGVLPADAVGRVMARQRELGIPFGEAAVDLGLVTRADVLLALAHQFDYPVLPVGDQGVSPELVAAFEPNSERVEALRQLRSQLVLRRAAEPRLNTIAVVGVGRGEGRSWLAANLAVLFSQLGERTLLIDGDLRHPRQQELFRLAPAGGLTSRLAERGEKCALQPHPRFGQLSVLQAGIVPPNPQELLARPAFGAQLAVARDSFQMTLVDTPAAEIGADAQLVAATCGSAVVVARRHASSQPRVARLAASLREAGVNVIGGVLLDF